MTPETSKLLLLYSKIADDSRVNVWQISLYTYLLTLWRKSGYKKQLNVSRKQLMAGAHFGSITTYHKCITRLKELEYIIYLPTYDAYQGTVIQIIT